MKQFKRQYRRNVGKGTWTEIILKDIQSWSNKLLFIHSNVLAQFYNSSQKMTNNIQMDSRTDPHGWIKQRGSYNHLFGQKFSTQKRKEFFLSYFFIASSDIRAIYIKAKSYCNRNPVYILESCDEEREKSMLKHTRSISFSLPLCLTFMAWCSQKALFSWRLADRLSSK